MVHFLNALKAPMGNFACLGNHDYDKPICINDSGEYDIFKHQISPVNKGFKRLLKQRRANGSLKFDPENIIPHQGLLSLFERTPFKLLHNETDQVIREGALLNIVGLGEHMAGKCTPDRAFNDYDPNYPGIILLHNPDGAPALRPYPGNIILCGHTHGGQVNLPLIKRRFILLENPHYVKGLFSIDQKWMYINRGLSAVLPLRCFSPPEALLLTLTRDLT